MLTILMLCCTCQIIFIPTTCWIIPHKKIILETWKECSLVWLPPNQSPPALTTTGIFSRWREPGWAARTVPVPNLSVVDMRCRAVVPSTHGCSFDCVYLSTRSHFVRICLLMRDKFLMFRFSPSNELIVAIALQYICNDSLMRTEMPIMVWICPFSYTMCHRCESLCSTLGLPVQPERQDD